MALYMCSRYIDDWLIDRQRGSEVLSSAARQEMTGREKRAGVCGVGGANGLTHAAKQHHKPFAFAQNSKLPLRAFSSSTKKLQKRQLNWSNKERIRLYQA